MFFYSGVFVASLVLLIEPSIRATCINIWLSFKRRVWHLSVTLFPSIFDPNPETGLRQLPDYVCTDGLTRRQHTNPLPHLGEHTGEQLLRHTVAGTTNVVRVIPNEAEVYSGRHPGTALQVSVPARPAVVGQIERSLQEAIDEGHTPAASTLNFINRVRHHLTHTVDPRLVSLHPEPGASLATVVFTHPQANEVSLATDNVLQRRGTKRKLQGFQRTAYDQHVKIARYQYNTRSNRRRRLNKEHTAAAVTAVWPITAT